MKLYYLDIKASRNMELGAVSLNLRLPEGVQVVSVRSMSAVSDEPVVFHQQGRNLRLAWHHLMPWRLREGDEVLRLVLKGLAEGLIELDETESELATSEGEILAGLPLTTARLRHQSETESVQVSVYPNPATSRSCLELGFGQPCRIQFEVVDALGRLIHQMEALS